MPTSRSTPVTPTGSTSACSTPATRTAPPSGACRSSSAPTAGGSASSRAWVRGSGTTCGWPGEWSPDTGQRHNAAKLLLDPYARAVEGEVSWGPEVYGHVVDDAWHGDGELRSDLDSRGHVPRCVVVDDEFDWEDDRPPNRSRSETVIYEAHVRNQTALHPDVPEELRGTYAGLAHPASVAHLTELGVTAVELLPVHVFTHEPHLVRRDMTNHWGYNTLGFFAPHPGYAAATDPQGVVDEVKGMVKLLHREGIEVILDVVYNHTAEQDRTGATLSWRGLDQRAYYRLDERGRDIDVTGCGNTLDLRHPVVCRMVLDSLRYWVQEFHVDGFRFDLAVALGRGRGDEFDPDHPFLVALRTDPVLSRVTLIAEPWDLGMHGWRTGQFPPPFMEWNDRFRDAVRRFWISDVRAQAHGQHSHGLQDLATRLAGSRDLFGHRDRGPTASVNFVAAHDGFTLADLDVLRPQAQRGERRGQPRRQQRQHLVEPRRRGPDRRPGGRRRPGPHHPQHPRHAAAVDRRADAQRRRRDGPHPGRQQQRLLPGQRHELGRLGPRARGRPTSSRRRSTWSRCARSCRRCASGSGPSAARCTTTAAATWSGTPPTAPPWAAAGTTRAPGWCRCTSAGAWMGAESALVVVNGGAHEHEVTLPAAPGVTAYRLLWDSDWERPQPPARAEAPGTVTVAGTSLRVYAAADVT